MKSLLFKGIGLIAILGICCTSCSKDDEASGPTITLISPTGSIDASSDINVNLQFTDDSGLQEVEVRLGNPNVQGEIYNTSTRGLSGTSDNLQYNVSPPAGINISGSNFIYVKCTDSDGNQTILDEGFQITDINPPSLDVLSFDNTGISPGSTSSAFVVFEYQDDSGVEYTAAELWWVDGTGNKLQLWDKKEETYTSPATSTNQVFASLVPPGGWPAGQSYQIILKARDTNGNEVEDSSLLGVVQ